MDNRGSLNWWEVDVGEAINTSGYRCQEERARRHAPSLTAWGIPPTSFSTEVNAETHAVITLSYVGFSWSILIGTFKFAIKSISWSCSFILTLSAVLNQDRALASYSARLARVISDCTAVFKEANRRASSAFYFFLISRCLSCTILYQIDITSLAYYIHASIYASS